MRPNVDCFFDKATATWTYVVYDDKHAAIIDSVLDFDLHSGKWSTQSADRIMSVIKNKSLTVEWILETHIHADHLSAASYIKKTVGGKIGISKHILSVLRAWQPILQNQDDTPMDGSQFDHLFADDEEFSVGSLTARVLYTPGHTPSDITYVVGDAAFVGDAMFLPDVGTGRCDFVDGSAARSFDSCRTILRLPEDTRIFVGHDYPPQSARDPACVTTVMQQKQTNIRIKDGIDKDDYVAKRERDDVDKDLPKLLYPALQVNLRAGNFGKIEGGRQFIKIPIAS